MNREIKVETLHWQGLTVEVSYEPNWLGCEHYAHLQLRSVVPDRAPLPVTETGYRSHFLTCGMVEEHGGPSAFAKAWLDATADTQAWRDELDRRRQLALF